LPGDFIGALPVNSCIHPAGLPIHTSTIEVLRRPVESAQYTSSQYATLAGDFDVRLSVGRTGQCWDNALAESFFASLKGECIDQQAWPARARARRAVVAYIGIRLHSALGYLTPNEYEAAGKENLAKLA
jgi:transposase InsO family protein